jgi:hypothetical protein
MTVHKLAFLVLFGSLAATAQESAQSERYTLKRDVDFSIYPRAAGDVVGSMPFDKSYDQLTAEQQNRLKLLYVALAEGDEPPFPLQGLGALYGLVAKGQQRLLVSGEFRADAEIDKDGNVASVAVLRSPNEEVTKFMANVLLLTKFKPAVCQGQPCSMGFPMKVNFELR